MAPMPPQFRRYLRYSSVGLEMGLSVILGLVIGQWLDKKLNTGPWLLLVFLLFGMVAGFRSVFRLMREVNRPSADDDDVPPGGTGGGRRP